MVGSSAHWRITVDKGSNGPRRPALREDADASSLARGRARQSRPSLLTANPSLALLLSLANPTRGARSDPDARDTRGLQPGAASGGQARRLVGTFPTYPYSGPWDSPFGIFIKTE